MVLEDYRISKAKENIKDFETQFKKTGNPFWLNKIEDEHKKIRNLQAKDMERLD